MIEIKNFGHVNSEGSLLIYSRDLFLGNIQDHLKSKSIEIIVRERESDFSHNMRKYYFKVVIGELQKAFLSAGMHKTQKDIDYLMRDKYLYYETVDEDTGEFEKHLHTLKKDETQVTRRMFKQYIEDCIRFASQYLHWAIPFPHEILSEEDLTYHQKDIKRMKEAIEKEY